MNNKTESFNSDQKLIDEKTNLVTEEANASNNEEILIEENVITPENDTIFLNNETFKKVYLKMIGKISFNVFSNRKDGTAMTDSLSGSVKNKTSSWLNKPIFKGLIQPYIGVGEISDLGPLGFQYVPSEISNTSLFTSTNLHLPLYDVCKERVSLTLFFSSNCFTFNTKNNGTRNYILSYQFCFFINDVTYLCLFQYPVSTSLIAGINGTNYFQRRLSLSTAIGHILEYLHLSNYNINRYRSGTYSKKNTISFDIQLVGYNSLEDHCAFLRTGFNFNLLNKKTILDKSIAGYKKFVYSYNKINYNIQIGDSKSSYYSNCNLYFRDIGTLIPNDYNSIYEVAEALDIKLKEIPAEFSNNIGNLIVNNYKLFISTVFNKAYTCLIFYKLLLGHNCLLPITTGSLAASIALKYAIDNDNGDIVKFDKMRRGLVPKPGVRINKNKNYINYNKLEDLSPSTMNIRTAAEKGFFGGYNQCFNPGIIKVKTFDYDLRSAYAIGITLCPDIDFCSEIKEYKNVELTLDDIKSPFEAFFGCVNFEFPKNTLPCMPQKLKDSLIFTLIGRNSYCSSPTIYLALKLGAKVFCVQGHKAKCNSSSFMMSFYRAAIKDRKTIESIYNKKSIFAKIAKEICNIVYGKISQGIIKEKNKSKNDDFIDLNPGQITIPTLANWATSFIRTVLIATANEIGKKGYTVYSVTTDGFITDAPKEIVDSIDVLGLKQVILAQYNLITGSNETSIWEIKHEQDWFLNVSTRVNVAPNAEGVSAHAGFSTKFKKGSKEDRDKFIIEMLIREGKLKKIDTKSTSFKELRENPSLDFTSKQVPSHPRMNYDYKNKPIEGTVRQENIEYKGEIYCFTNFLTEPYKNIDEYLRTIKAVKTFEIVKTQRDVNDVIFKAKDSRKIRSLANKSWMELRSLIILYRNKKIDVPIFDSLGRGKSIDLINNLNYTKRKYTIRDWKNATNKNIKNIEQLPIENLKELYDKLLSISVENYENNNF